MSWDAKSVEDVVLALFDVWYEVHESQLRELHAIGVSLQPAWGIEVAAADTASIALGIRFAPLSSSIRELIIQHVGDNIAKMLDVADMEQCRVKCVAHLDATRQLMRQGHEGAALELIAKRVVAALASDIEGLESALLVRFAKLVVASTEYVENTAAPAATQALLRHGAVSDSEMFFFRKLGEGLAGETDQITVEERDALLRTASSMVERPSITRERAMALQEKCSRALSRAYERDLSDNSLAAGMTWRAQNAQLYKESQRVLSGVVQGWYLSIGRRLESNALSSGKRGTGCFSAIVSAGYMLLSLIGLFAIALALSAYWPRP